MKYLKINPKLTLPWDHEKAKPYLLAKAREEKMLLEGASLVDILTKRPPGAGFSVLNVGWGSVPSVPIIEASGKARDLGEFVLYNGHNRRAAAIEADIALPIYLIENNPDLKKINESKERVWSLENYSYDEIREILSECALRYYKRNKSI